MSNPPELKDIWLREQAALQPQIVTHDSTAWAPCLDEPIREASQQQTSQQQASPQQPIRQQASQHQPLRLVGGLDISFFPASEPQQQAGSAEISGDKAPAFEDQQQHQGAGGVAALVVVSFPDLEPVYQDYEYIAQFPCPYMPGFLAFREVPFYSALLDRAAQAAGGIHFPQVVLVDGCGLLHPQRCGSARCLGVVRSIPTIGVSKNVFAIGGLDRSAIEEAFEAAQQQPQNQGCPATVPLRKGKDRVAFPLKDCGSSPEEDAFEAAQQQPLIQGCSAADPLTTLGSSPAEAAVANAQQQPHDQGCPAAVPFRLLGSNPEEAAFEAAQQQPHDQGCSAAATLESSVSGPFQAGVVTIQQQPLNQGCCPATVPVSSSSSDSLEARANATPPQQPRNQGCCPATVPVTSSSSSPSEAKDGATPQQHLPPPDALLQSHRQQYHHNHGHPKRHHHSHDPKRHHHNNFRQHHPQQHKAHLQKASIVVSRARVQEALACSQGPSLRVEALPSGHWLCSLKDAASSELLGAALCGPSTKKPIYVSVGHNVSLETAVAVVLRCCRYRNPEPLRLADLRSRAIVSSLSRVA